MGSRQLRDEAWRHVTMVTKFLNLSNISWQRRPFAYEGKIWATILFLSSGKSFTVNVFAIFFFATFAGPGMLRSRNFATIATRRNNFSSLWRRQRAISLVKKQQQQHQQHPTFWDISKPRSSSTRSNFVEEVKHNRDFFFPFSAWMWY